MERISSDGPAEAEVVVCTYCVFPNSPNALWCKRCGASVSYASIVGPLDAAVASGFMWRGAVRGRPQRFVLVSVWMLFLPKLMWNLLSAFLIFAGGITSLLALGMFGLALMALAFTAVAFMMLYQVTRNYLTIPPMNWDETSGDIGGKR